LDLGEEVKMKKSVIPKQILTLFYLGLFLIITGIIIKDVFQRIELGGFTLGFGLGLWMAIGVVHYSKC